MASSATLHAAPSTLLQRKVILKARYKRIINASRNRLSELTGGFFFVYDTLTNQLSKKEGQLHET